MSLLGQPQYYGYGLPKLKQKKQEALLSAGLSLLLLVSYQAYQTFWTLSTNISIEENRQMEPATNIGPANPTVAG